MYKIQLANINEGSLGESSIIDFFKVVNGWHIELANDYFYLVDNFGTRILKRIIKTEDDGLFCTRYFLPNSIEKPIRLITISNSLQPRPETISFGSHYPQGFAIEYSLLPLPEAIIDMQSFISVMSYSKLSKIKKVMALDDVADCFIHNYSFDKWLFENADFNVGTQLLEKYRQCTERVIPNFNYEALIADKRLTNIPDINKVRTYFAQVFSTQIDFV